MVNASLNWASVIGIVLAVGGALLYFVRTFKPALARDYDVFFAAVGLLCGGILFFQGWRLDPILQFGQSLLAGTTIFFAYESVRLRGISTEQARRSAYFDEELTPSPRQPSADRLRDSWNEPYDRLAEPRSARRQFASNQAGRQDYSEEERYRLRRNIRPVIPEETISRRFASSSEDLQATWSNDDKRATRQLTRFSRSNNDSYEKQDQKPAFGDRRRRDKQRQGSRPTAIDRSIMKSSSSSSSLERENSSSPIAKTDLGVPRGTQLRLQTEEASFSPVTSAATASQRPTPRSSRSRDNSSRFDN